MDLWTRLHDRAVRGETGNVAVVGAGFIGRGIVHQLARTPGLRAAIVVNRTPQRAVEAFERAGSAPAEVVVSDDPARLAAAVRGAAPAVTSSLPALDEVEGIDVVVEATGAMAVGAQAVLGGLERGRDVVSMNAELDATVGHLLHDTARRHGARYTVGDGDQPGALLRQLDFVVGMGFEVVAAVNCKRNLDVHQNPTDSQPYADRDGTSVLMTTAFGDGTKMQIENAVVANLTGLVPDRLGMHGVRTSLAEVARDIPAAMTRRGGVVEYTLGGDFGGGVGVLARPHDPGFAAPYLRYSKMGEGPEYFFFRPYHLLHFEVPRTIAELVLDGRTLGTLLPRPVAEVVAVAKRDLRPGDTLDGIGGYGCYGLIASASEAGALLPIGLADRARITRAVRRDDPVPRDAVELDADAEIVRLRGRQDTLVAPHHATGLA